MWLIYIEAYFYAWSVFETTDIHAEHLRSLPSSGRSHVSRLKKRSFAVFAERKNPVSWYLLMMTSWLRNSFNIHLNIILSCERRQRDK